MQKIILFLVFAVGMLSGYFANSIVNKTPITIEVNASKGLESKFPLVTAKTTFVNKQPKKQSLNTSSATNDSVAMRQKELTGLTAQIEHLDNKFKNLQSKYDKNNNRLIQLTMEMETLDESSITDDQMMTLVKDDFSEFRRDYRGAQRDRIFDFHQQEEDLDWGYDMQTRISDFILTHYNTVNVQLTSVKCKQHSCELLIKETEKITIFFS